VELQKNKILSELTRDILPLQGLKQLCTDNNVHIDFDPIENAFPNSTFPVGCTHEFLTTCVEDLASTNGFIAFLLSKLMQFDGVAIWISASRTLFPASLKRFGLEPDRIIFVDLKDEREVLYATEEALQCKQIAVVAGEIKNISFKESRRLQLAAEQSRVTGLLIRHQPRIINTIACVSRWRITSLASTSEDGMPGVGFPSWKVELLKIRSGKPGRWQVEFSSNHLKEIRQTILTISQAQIRNTA
jgi:protein ImuA